MINHFQHKRWQKSLKWKFVWRVKISFNKKHKGSIISNNSKAILSTIKTENQIIYASKHKHWSQKYQHKRCWPHLTTKEICFSSNVCITIHKSKIKASYREVKIDHIYSISLYLGVSILYSAAYALASVLAIDSAREVVPYQVGPSEVSQWAIH